VPRQSLRIDGANAFRQVRVIRGYKELRIVTGDRSPWNQEGAISGWIKPRGDDL